MTVTYCDSGETGTSMGHKACLSSAVSFTAAALKRCHGRSFMSCIMSGFIRVSSPLFC